jgi:hypothetical protein
MSEPTEFMEELLGVLRNSEEEKLEGLFHGINLPPNWFEMVQDNVKHAIKIDYVVPDSDQNESGTLTLPIYFVDGRYKILLVGG